jgi:hypothetical protein
MKMHMSVDITRRPRGVYLVPGKSGSISGLVAMPSFYRQISPAG